MVSDGEFGKPNFAGYVSDRLTGFETRPPDPGQSAIGNWGRDRKAFRDFYEQDSSAQAGGGGGASMVCTGPISYVGQARGAGRHRQLQGPRSRAPRWRKRSSRQSRPAPSRDSAGTTTTAPSGSTSARSPTAMHEEYKAIVDAGFILQIDDPRIVVPTMT